MHKPFGANLDEGPNHIPPTSGQRLPPFAHPALTASRSTAKFSTKSFILRHPMTHRAMTRGPSAKAFPCRDVKRCSHDQASLRRDSHRLQGEGLWAPCSSRLAPAKAATESALAESRSAAVGEGGFLATAAAPKWSVPAVLAENASEQPSRPPSAYAHMKQT